MCRVHSGTFSAYEWMGCMRDVKCETSGTLSLELSLELLLVVTGILRQFFQRAPRKRVAGGAWARLQQGAMQL